MTIITDEMVDAYIRGVDAKALKECSENFQPVVRQWVRDGLSAVAPLIAAAEREACAMAAIQLKVQYASSFDHGFNTALGCAAAAIRARSS